jgi:hypothetical protein
MSEQSLDMCSCTTERIRVTVTSGTEVWQARIGTRLAEQLREDSEVLGLQGRTEIVKAALQLLHRRATEERMARSVDDFYAGATPPLPIGVLPAEDAEDDDISDLS